MKLMLRFFSLLFFLNLLVLVTSAQTIRYVKEGGEGTKDGSSWANAADDLQGTIQASAANNIVAVAKGTYLPTRKANALATVTLNNRENAFVLKANVKIYGGFAGTEIFTDAANLLAQLAARNLRTNTSTLSGDFNANDLITGSGTASLAFANNTENAYHVLISAGNVGSAELNGFTISGGHANGEGMAYSVNSENTSHIRGGGVIILSSSPKILNVQIINNMVSATNSFNTVYGGGICVYNSSSIITNFVVRDNMAKHPDRRPFGAGCANISNNSEICGFTNGLFENNIALCSSDNAYGGAIYNNGGMKITNVIFSKNRALAGSRNGSGGAIYNEGATLKLNNITAYGNSGSFVSFLYHIGSGQETTTINNSIIWNDFVRSSASSAPIVVTNSLVQGGYAGTGNLNEDPQFADAANGNFTLKRTSPAIDAGNKNLYADAQTAKDFAGANRLSSTNIDMGAYEYQFNTTALHFDGANDVVAIPASTTFDLPALTLEAWVKPERQSGGNQTIFASRSSSATRFSISHNTNGIALWNGSTGSSVNLPQPFALNRWYHLAVVLKASTADVYINGQLIGSTTNSASMATNLPFQIGAAVPDGSFEAFGGSIDEVRIWEGGRTATEITDNYDKPLVGLVAQTSLLAYFEFGEGTADADNTAVNTLINNGTTAINASLVNMALTGTTSNFIEGYAMVAPINTIIDDVFSSRLSLKWTEPYIGIVEQYQIEVATDSDFTQPISGSPFIADGLATSKIISGLASTTLYYVRVKAEKASVSGQGTYSLIQNITTPATISPPGSAVNFDGVNDYVSLGSSDRFKPKDQLSIGVWVNRADWNVATFGAIISNTQSGGYSINIADAGTTTSGKYITALVYRNGAYARPKFEVSKLTPGWHYIGLTYNGQVTKLYVDGNEVDSDDVGSVKQIGYHAANSTLIGAEVDVADVPSSTAPRYFNGSVDELRFYDIALTAEEIKADMLSATNTRTANLVAQYNFDRPLPNTSTQLADYGPNNSNGVLRNFAFSGTASNWVESYAMVVPTAEAATAVTDNGFTANWQAATVGTADNYILDVATTIDFTAPISGSPFTVNALNKEITGLSPLTNYYYRVRADKTTVTGQGVPTATINVKTLPIIQPDANNILYVNTSVSGGNQSGSSWANAMPQLADALKWARTKYDADNAIFDTAPLKIYVAKGTYKPLYNAASNALTSATDRDNAFVMVKNVQIYGGFNPVIGIDDLTDTRIFGTDGSILSGDIGTANDNTDNTYHVVVSSGAVGNATLDGLTFTGGNANGSGYSIINDVVVYEGNGGGMYNDGTGLTITNCAFINNAAKDVGGTGNGAGIYNAATSLTINASTFSGNMADNNGGAIYNIASSSLHISNTTFTENLSGYGGGGVFSMSSEVTISNSHFKNNAATDAAGGSGGAICNAYGVSPIITACTFTGNTAMVGGAILNAQVNDVSAIMNCVFYGNTADLGAAMYNAYSSTLLGIVNSTFYGNTASTSGGAIYNQDASPTISNIIIYGNSSGIAHEDGDSSSPVVNYSNVQQASGIYAGMGNINTNPLFINVANPAGADGIWGTSDDGLALQAGSAAINAGTPDITALNLPSTDLAGNPRVQNNWIDMGAYENYVNETTLPVTLISFTAKTEGNYAKLQWQTSAETTNKGFEIYRSGDDKVFVKIGELAAAVRSNNYSTIYTFVDKQPLNGNNYYKLVQVDKDGRSTELGERALNFKLSTLDFQLYPNPTDNQITISFAAGRFSQLQLLDLTGKVLESAVIGASENTKTLSLVQYPAGTYLISLGGKGIVETRKVIKK